MHVHVHIYIYVHTYINTHCALHPVPFFSGSGQAARSGVDLAASSSKVSSGEAPNLTAFASSVKHPCVEIRSMDPARSSSKTRSVAALARGSVIPQLHSVAASPFSGRK